MEIFGLTLNVMACETRSQWRCCCRCCWYWYWCCCRPTDVFEIGRKDGWSKGSYLFKLNALHYSPLAFSFSPPSLRYLSISFLLAVYLSCVLPFFICLLCPILGWQIWFESMHKISSNTDTGRTSSSCVCVCADAMCFHIFVNIECFRYKEFADLKFQNKNKTEIK